VGGQTSKGAAVTQASIWLVNLSSRLLAIDDREAVLGDIVESGETGPQALIDVFGLVIRRQAALYWHLSTWLVLGGFVAPFGFLLSLVSKRTSDLSAIYFWMYTNNWDWKLLSYPGFWVEITDWTPHILLSYLALSCWSWTVGFLVASLSRRAFLLNGAHLSVALLLGTLLGAPQTLGHVLILGSGRAFYGNAPVFAVAFYRVALPKIIQFCFVIAPALYGMTQGSRRSGTSRTFRLFLASALTLAIAQLGVQNLVRFQQMLSTHALLLCFAATGPLMYFLERTVRGHHVSLGSKYQAPKAENTKSSNEGCEF
jgi:hypothetical protein